MSRASTFALVLLAFFSTQAAAAETFPDREVFFGEQHVHTSWSYDAFAFGDRLTGPEDFYRYATGQKVQHPGGFPVQITKPLDWAAVTEHAEYMGMIQQASDPDSALRKASPVMSRMLEAGADRDAMLAFKVLSVSIAKGHPFESLTDPAVVAPVWRKIVAAADRFYEPGEFTTFAAFEWSSSPESNNLHRNIFFRDSSEVPKVPFSAIDSEDPLDLWHWMDTQRASGNDLLAVSHNANLSNGNMYPYKLDNLGRPIDRGWAEARLRNEPLIEMKQVKGQSETTPGLSPNDEFANYEVFVWKVLGGSGGPPRQHGSYARQALKDGLSMQQSLGVNPYRFGAMGGSDSHVSVVPYRQDNFFGVHGTVDDTIEKRMDNVTVLGLKSLWVSTAGLSAVWAAENTREGIFDGMRRKETYATSGVRIRLRFFGGWEFEPGMVDQDQWVKSAYADGVTMGGELPDPAAAAPTFLIWALKDPDSGNLDRVQVVKGWSQAGQSFEKIYDVVWAGDRKTDPVTGKLPPIGSTVDVIQGTYTNTIGAAELKTVWKDPDFDPDLNAFYYARVLEIPTPRWSTIQAAKLGRIAPSGAGYTAVIQERAWSSPIWYTPGLEPSQNAAQGRTIAELQKQGAVSLSDDEIRNLIVGHAVVVRNTVTDRQYQVLYGEKGRRMVTAVNGQATDSAQAAELFHAQEAAYEIGNGQLTTVLDGTPFTITIYRLEDKYVAAKSDEFGFANYDVELAP